LHTEQLKRVGCDPCAVPPFRSGSLDAQVERCIQKRGDAFKTLLLALPEKKFGRRGLQLLHATTRNCVREHHQLVRFGKRQVARAAVHDAEHRRRCTNAERERRDCAERETRLAQQPRSV
jgi:hypothetical protein